MVGKGEIARCEQFLHFPKYFQKACFAGASNGVIVWEWVKAYFWHYLYNPQLFISARYICSQAENNQVKFEINLYDENQQATDLKALDENEEEIDSCNYMGSGTPSSPFYVVSYVNLTSNTESNGCGVQVVSLNLFISK